MRKRNLIGAAAFSLALAGGGVAGALIGTPGVSGAQDGSTSTSAPAADAAKPDRPARPEGGPGMHGRPGLQAAADALGITPEELRTELEAGKSIAQIAEAKGIDKQVVIDAIVKEGTEKLNEQIAKLPERASELVDREGLPQRPEGGPRGDHAPGDDAPAPADDTTTSTASS